MVECLVLIKADHFDGPFHRRAGTVQDKAAIRFTGDCDNTTVKPRRKPPIDFKLGCASGFAFFQRRVIQKRKLDGALNLEGALAYEKYDSSVGVTAPDRDVSKRGRRAQQLENRILRACLRLQRWFLPMLAVRDVYGISLRDDI